MKHLFAAVAVAALGFATVASATTATTAAASSGVASGTYSAQLGAGTTVSASQATDHSVANANALSLQPVFSVSNASATTTGSGTNGSTSNDPLEISGGFSFDTGAASATSSAH